MLMVVQRVILDEIKVMIWMVSYKVAHLEVGV